MLALVGERPTTRRCNRKKLDGTPSPLPDALSISIPSDGPLSVPVTCHQHTHRRRLSSTFSHSLAPEARRKASTTKSVDSPSIGRATFAPVGLGTAGEDKLSPWETLPERSILRCALASGGRLHKRKGSMAAPWSPQPEVSLSLHSEIVFFFDLRAGAASGVGAEQRCL